MKEGHQMKKKILYSFAVFAMLATGLAGGGSGSISEPTQVDASQPGVYLVAPKWWGWCPNPHRWFSNEVNHMIQWNETTFDSSNVSGDDIIWSRVKLHQKNVIHVQAGCKWGFGSSGTLVEITPRRHGQAFFVAPTGQIWTRG